VNTSNRLKFLSFIFSGFVLLTNTCLANEADKLKQGQIHGTTHQDNIGNIVFLETIKPINKYQQQDFINTFSLNTHKNLYFTAFLDKPLTNYLQELGPEHSINELNKKGNYHFSFYVDRKLVYTENLNLGAVLLDEKNNDTILTKPLFSEANEDSWGRFLWMRFMHFGGSEALTEGHHILKVELRPYLKTSEVKVGKLIANGQISIDVVKPIATEQQIAVQDIAAKSGWKLSAEPYDKEKIRALNRKIAQRDFKDISSIVVIKNGELLLEEYFNGSQRDSLHNPRSVGKSFASTMLGIAIQDGFIENEEQKISDFYDLKHFKNFSAEKAKVSLKDLVTMSSGFDADDSDSQSIGNEENMYPTDDWVKFALDLPMAREGKINKLWAYFTAGVVILGDIIDKSVPNGLESYAHEKLFEPLGIEKYQWQYTPQNVANTAGGIQLRALDFAKYGQLYKNGGAWNDTQIIPKKWATASLSKQIARAQAPNSGHYGYLFWHDTLSLNQHPYDVAYATGNGGNKIYIFKDIPLVIVITATAYNKRYAHDQVNQMMTDFILPAILN
jgi:CubicO group peptidase (beta-lactamase class C family)